VAAAARVPGPSCSRGGIRVLGLRGGRRALRSGRRAAGQRGTGAAYAFSELGSSQQTLVGTATQPPTELFGISVSIDAPADRILVGSPSTNLGDGAAFVFQKGAGGFTQSQELVEANPSGADLFGYSVALDYTGNVALIGAPESRR
jgi:hypothetical protein